MKPSLLILSDLLGFSAEEYIRILSEYFTIKYFDVRGLADIDKALSKEEIHTAFLKGGMGKAVENSVFSKGENQHILAFSIGGSIAWKAALKNRNIENLWLVSSTRLRKETERPACNISLFYGEKDKFKPKEEWFKEMDLKPKIYSNFGHELYEDVSFTHKLCQMIIKKFSEAD